MIKNVGKTDRIVRLVVGVVLLAMVFVGPQTLWGLLGLVLIATAGISFCPVYPLIGVNTCEAGSKPAEPVQSAPSPEQVTREPAPEPEAPSSHSESPESSSPDEEDGSGTEPTYRPPEV